MGIISFGTRESRALSTRCPIAAQAGADLVNSATATMGDVVEVGGDFTRGVGQGFGIVLGLVAAGWTASKMLR
jgi:hypothetical protein